MAILTDDVAERNFRSHGIRVVKQDTSSSPLEPQPTVYRPTAALLEAIYDGRPPAPEVSGDHDNEALAAGSFAFSSRVHAVADQLALSDITDLSSRDRRRFIQAIFDPRIAPDFDAEVEHA